MATKDITDIQVLQAQQIWREDQGGPWGYEILMFQTGQPQKVCMQAMMRAERRDLLGYGVSLRTAWITDKGRELLSQHQHESL